MPIWFADTQNKPFARKLWFGWLGRGGWSGLFGNYWDLGNYRVRGVRSNVGEADAQKNSPEEIGVKTYTSDQISQVLKKLRISGLEESILSELENQ